MINTKTIPTQLKNKLTGKPELTRKLINHLHTAKERRDPMNHYMNTELEKQIYYTLLQSPQLFATQLLYNQFIERFFPDLAREHPHLTNTVIQMIMVQQQRKNMARLRGQENRIRQINHTKVTHDIKKQKQKRRITYNNTTNYTIQQLINDTVNDISKLQASLLREESDKVTLEIERELPRNGINNLDDIPEIKAMREKHRKILKRRNKELDKNKENRVQWQMARLEDKPPRFKVWDETPNPKTRHIETDGQIVPLEEKFIVINDKTGDIDEVDYPGDIHCSASNKANCLCGFHTTNNPKGVTPYDRVREKMYKRGEQIHRKYLQERMDRDKERVKKRRDKDRKERQKHDKQEKERIQREINEKKEKLRQLEKQATQEQQAPQEEEGLPDYTACEEDTRYQNLHKPEDIAEYFRMDYKKDGDGGYTFTDKINHTTLHVDKFYASGGGSKLYLDNTSNGKLTYDLKELLRYYRQAPQLMQQAPQSINFTTGNQVSNVAGRCITLTRRDLSHVDVSIDIFPAAFRSNKRERANIQQTMYHEMGHAIDSRLTLPEYLIEDTNRISHLDNGWQDAIRKDNDYQRKQGWEPEDASWYGSKNADENLAESMSMAAFDGLKDKRNAVLEDYQSESVDLIEWVQIHPNKYKYLKRLLKNTVADDFMNSPDT